MAFTCQGQAWRHCRALSQHRCKMCVLGKCSLRLPGHRVKNGEKEPFSPSEDDREEGWICKVRKPGRRDTSEEEEPTEPSGPGVRDGVPEGATSTTPGPSLTPDTAGAGKHRLAHGSPVCRRACSKGPRCSRDTGPRSNTVPLPGLPAPWTLSSLLTLMRRSLLGQETLLQNNPISSNRKSSDLDQ